MPWFEAKPKSHGWGWHWTMDTFNPDRTKNGRRQIAAHYYPLCEPYDSGDPAVIEYHLLLMKLAGIDGVIVDWYGHEDFLDYALIHRNIKAMFFKANQLGLRFAVCYEDQTIPRLVAAGRLAASDRVRHARGELEWLRENWFSSPGYLKLQGKPVLFSFGQSGLTDAEWSRVLGSANNALNYLSLHHRRTAAAGAFDWPLPREGLIALDRFHADAKNWRVAVPVAFPRFHDIYAEAKVHDSWGHIDDDEGRTFATTLERGLRSGSPVVQIATWNDWGEGTVIEPSKEFGYRDLETVQTLRRRFIDAEFQGKPNDLRLPLRLLRLRRDLSVQRTQAATLDQVADSLASGSALNARAALEKLETHDPVRRGEGSCTRGSIEP